MAGGMAYVIPRATTEAETMALLWCRQVRQLHDMSAGELTRHCLSQGIYTQRL